MLDSINMSIEMLTNLEKNIKNLENEMKNLKNNRKKVFDLLSKIVQKDSACEVPNTKRGRNSTQKNEVPLKAEN